MTTTVLKYYFIFSLLFLCIGLNAKDKNVEDEAFKKEWEKGKTHFLNGAYSQAVNVLNAVEKKCDKLTDCKQWRDGAQQCQKWFEAAIPYSNAADSSQLKTAIDYYNQIRTMRNNIDSTMQSDTVVEGKIKDCNNKIEQQRKGNERPTDTVIRTGTLPPPEPSGSLFHDKIPAPFGIKQFNTKQPFEVVRGIVYCGTQAGGLIGGIVNGVKWYKADKNNQNAIYIDDETNFKKDIDKYRCRFWWSVGIMAGSYVLNSFDNCLWTKKKESGKTGALNITPIITPQYSEINLTYNF